MENLIEQSDSKEVKTYELGFLASPLVPADKIEEFASNLTGAMMEVSGGNVVSQVTPRMRPLAYPISKNVSNKNTTYKDAYLGAVKFQAQPETIEKVKTLLDKNAEIIRFLMIAIPKGADRVKVKKNAGRHVKIAKDVPGIGENADKGTPMSSEDIDKEIEGLIADTSV